jgi:uncharacterized protein (DUF1697 family)
MTTFIALLRGINVGGHRPVAMPRLRELCGEIGLADAQTYIQSGNLVFSATGKAPAIEAKLEKAIEGAFGFAVDVVVRSGTQWAEYVAGNPMPAAAETQPNLLLLGLSKSRPQGGAIAALRERAAAGEQVELVGEALWVFFPGGSGRSKLTPGQLDRAVGSPVTTRNWRTVVKLAEMAGVAT